jgi:hypothetical protein
MKRFIEISVVDSEWGTVGGHADPRWYTDRIDEATSRFDAEARLLQALHDPHLSDEGYHAVRIHFDGFVGLEATI